jgi:hypothetical protein
MKPDITVIDLRSGDRHVQIKLDGAGAGSILSNLHCTDAEATRDGWTDEEQIRWNGQMDALESLILAHACAGVDVTGAYAKGLWTALEAIENNC